MDRNKKALIITGVVLSLLPVWRSGGRGNLNFWQFVVNHMVFGPPVEYVPEEDYSVISLRRR